jgi:hypothetical protein
MLAVVMSLLFCGCTKTGPTGPAGAQGAAGAQGSKGDKGATGATGTANVIYLDWVQIKFVDFKAQLDVLKLTDQIHEQGEVVVFSPPTRLAVPAPTG